MGNTSAICCGPRNYYKGNPQNEISASGSSSGTSGGAASGVTSGSSNASTSGSQRVSDGSVASRAPSRRQRGSEPQGEPASGAQAGQLPKAEEGAPVKLDFQVPNIEKMVRAKLGNQFKNENLNITVRMEIIEDDDDYDFKESRLTRLKRYMDNTYGKGVVAKSTFDIKSVKLQNKIISSREMPSTAKRAVTVTKACWQNMPQLEQQLEPEDQISVSVYMTKAVKELGKNYTDVVIYNFLKLIHPKRSGILVLLPAKNEIELEVRYGLLHDPVAQRLKCRERIRIKFETSNFDSIPQQAIKVSAAKSQQDAIRRLEKASAREPQPSLIPVLVLLTWDPADPNISYSQKELEEYVRKLLQNIDPTLPCKILVSPAASGGFDYYYMLQDDGKASAQPDDSESHQKKEKDFDDYFKPIVQYRDPTLQTENAPHYLLKFNRSLPEKAREALLELGQVATAHDPQGLALIKAEEAEYPKQIVSADGGIKICVVPYGSAVKYSDDDLSNDCHKILELIRPSQPGTLAVDMMNGMWNFTYIVRDTIPKLETRNRTEYNAEDAIELDYEDITKATERIKELEAVYIERRLAKIIKIAVIIMFDCPPTKEMDIKSQVHGIVEEAGIKVPGIVKVTQELDENKKMKLVYQFFGKDLHIDMQRDIDRRPEETLPKSGLAKLRLELLSKLVDTTSLSKNGATLDPEMSHNMKKLAHSLNLKHFKILNNEDTTVQVVSEDESGYEHLSSDQEPEFYALLNNQTLTKAIPRNIELTIQHYSLLSKQQIDEIIKLTKEYLERIGLMANGTVLVIPLLVDGKIVDLNYLFAPTDLAIDVESMAKKKGSTDTNLILKLFDQKLVANLLCNSIRLDDDGFLGSKIRQLNNSKILIRQRNHTALLGEVLIELQDPSNFESSTDTHSQAIKTFVNSFKKLRRQYNQRRTVKLATVKEVASGPMPPLSIHVLLSHAGARLINDRERILIKEHTSQFIRDIELKSGGTMVVTADRENDQLKLAYRFAPDDITIDVTEQSKVKETLLTHNKKVGGQTLYFDFERDRDRVLSALSHAQKLDSVNLRKSRGMINKLHQQHVMLKNNVAPREISLRHICEILLDCQLGTLELRDQQERVDDIIQNHLPGKIDIGLVSDEPLTMKEKQECEEKVKRVLKKLRIRLPGKIITSKVASHGVGDFELRFKPDKVALHPVANRTVTIPLYNIEAEGVITPEEAHALLEQSIPLKLGTDEEDTAIRHQIHADNVLVGGEQINLFNTLVSDQINYDDMVDLLFESQPMPIKLKVKVRDIGSQIKTTKEKQELFKKLQSKVKVIIDNLKLKVPGTLWIKMKSTEDGEVNIIECRFVPENIYLTVKNVENMLSKPVSTNWNNSPTYKLDLEEVDHSVAIPPGVLLDMNNLNLIDIINELHKQYLRMTDPSISDAIVPLLNTSNIVQSAVSRRKERIRKGLRKPEAQIHTGAILKYAQTLGGGNLVIKAKEGSADFGLTYVPKKTPIKKSNLKIIYANTPQNLAKAEGFLPIDFDDAAFVDAVRGLEKDVVNPPDGNLECHVMIEEGHPITDPLKLYINDILQRIDPKTPSTLYVQPHAGDLCHSKCWYRVENGVPHLKTAFLCGVENNTIDSIARHAPYISLSKMSLRSDIYEYYSGALPNQRIPTNIYIDQRIAAITKKLKGQVMQLLSNLDPKGPGILVVEPNTEKKGEEYKYKYVKKPRKKYAVSKSSPMEAKYSKMLFHQALPIYLEDNYTATLIKAHEEKLKKEQQPTGPMEIKIVFYGIEPDESTWAKVKMHVDQFLEIIQPELPGTFIVGRDFTYRYITGVIAQDEKADSSAPSQIVKEDHAMVQKQQPVKDLEKMPTLLRNMAVTCTAEYVIHPNASILPKITKNIRGVKSAYATADSPEVVQITTKQMATSSNQPFSKVYHYQLRPIPSPNAGEMQSLLAGSTEVTPTNMKIIHNEQFHMQERTNAVVSMIQNFFAREPLNPEEQVTMEKDILQTMSAIQPTCNATLIVHKSHQISDTDSSYRFSYVIQDAIRSATAVSNAKVNKFTAEKNTALHQLYEVTYLQQPNEQFMMDLISNAELLEPIEKPTPSEVRSNKPEVRIVINVPFTGPSLNEGELKRIEGDVFSMLENMNSDLPTTILVTPQLDTQSEDRHFAYHLAVANATAEPILSSEPSTLGKYDVIFIPTPPVQTTISMVMDSIKISPGDEYAIQQIREKTAMLGSASDPPIVRVILNIVDDLALKREIKNKVINNIKRILDTVVPRQSCIIVAVLKRKPGSDQTPVTLFYCHTSSLTYKQKQQWLNPGNDQAKLKSGYQLKCLSHPEPEEMIVYQSQATAITLPLKKKEIGSILKKETMASENEAFLNKPRKSKKTIKCVINKCNKKGDFDPTVKEAVSTDVISIINEVEPTRDGLIIVTLPTGTTADQISYHYFVESATKTLTTAEATDDVIDHGHEVNERRHNICFYPKLDDELQFIVAQLGVRIHPTKSQWVSAVRELECAHKQQTTDECTQLIVYMNIHAYDSEVPLSAEEALDIKARLHQTLDLLKPSCPGIIVISPKLDPELVDVDFHYVVGTKSKICRMRDSEAEDAEQYEYAGYYDSSWIDSLHYDLVDSIELAYAPLPNRNHLIRMFCSATKIGQFDKNGVDVVLAKHNELERLHRADPAQKSDIQKTDIVLNTKRKQALSRNDQRTIEEQIRHHLRSLRELPKGTVVVTQRLGRFTYHFCVADRYISKVTPAINEMLPLSAGTCNLLFHARLSEEEMCNIAAQAVPLGSEAEYPKFSSKRTKRKQKSIYIIMNQPYILTLNTSHHEELINNAPVIIEKLNPQTNGILLCSPRIDICSSGSTKSLNNYSFYPLEDERTKRTSAKEQALVEKSTFYDFCFIPSPDDKFSSYFVSHSQRVTVASTHSDSSNDIHVDTDYPLTVPIKVYINYGSKLNTDQRKQIYKETRILALNLRLTKPSTILAFLELEDIVYYCSSQIF